MATITRFHVTWLLASALPELVGSEPTSPSPSPSLGTQPGYVAAFERASVDDSEWVKPWDGYPERNKYWTRTLSAGYEDVAGETAWIKQVPLRAAKGYQPTTEIPGVTLWCDRYLYPSGVAVAVTATVAADLTIVAAKRVHQRLCQEEVFAASDGTKHDIVTMLADEVERLEAEVLGNAAASGEHGDGVGIVTTITGSRGTLSAEDAQALLEALCYPGDSVGATTVLSPKRQKFSDTIRVAGGGAQASWSPTRSTAAAGQRKVTCYHHNLVLSSLHTDELLNLVRVASDSFSMESDRAQQLYRRAAIVLGWLYGGADRSIYSTGFAKAAIDDSGLVDRINLIRARLNIGTPIHGRE